MEKQGGSGKMSSDTVIVQFSVSRFLPCVSERLARSVNHSPIKITWRETMVRGDFCPNSLLLSPANKGRRIEQHNM